MLSWLQFPKVVFSDNVTVCMLLDVDKDGSLPVGSSRVHVTVISEVQYNQADRSASDFPNTPNDAFSTERQLLTFDFSVPGTFHCHIVKHTFEKIEIRIKYVITLFTLLQYKYTKTDI